MSTTIQINDETAEILKRYKEQFHLSTYDEVIRKCMTLKVAEQAKHYQGILGKIDRKKLLENVREKKD